MPQALLDACSEDAARFDWCSALKPDARLALRTTAIVDADAESIAVGATSVRWISNSNGSWHDPVNWVDGSVPSDGDSVGFGLNENDLQFEEIDINDAGTGVFLPNSVLRIERKMTFSDTSGGGDPALADDGMTFDVVQANGTGGSPVVFNVPVTADTISSNRHGAVFNREITVHTILARSQHQDRWQINASATLPIVYLIIDEQRGPDGDSIDGSFAINSNLSIEQVDQVWGRMIVGAESLVSVGNYLFFNYANQTENNNINPITLDGNLQVKTFSVFDIALESISDLGVGTYGRPGNENATFEVEFISGDGLLIVRPDEVFFHGFESDAPLDE
jgi:hypothetical protein